MRVILIMALSSTLFKSYLRSSRGATVSFFSRPKVMLIIDIALFIIPLILSQFVLGIVNVEMIPLFVPFVLELLIGIPVLMTSAMIVAGLMFELGQGSAISSSEAVNWLPITPREYVVASALSSSYLYSAFLAITAGVTLPLTLKFEVFSLWPMLMLLSVISLLLGAFVVEILRAAMNRVSSTVYRKSGRFGMITRLVALIILFVLVQIAFQPYFLYWVLGQIAGGIEVAWVVPIVWPSNALISLIRLDFLQAMFFSVLSIVFTLFVYEIASQLRRVYWSPVPISISMDSSVEYVPMSSRGLKLGFTPLESALALKEFRALLRRKDMARFIAIPIVVLISLILPMLLMPGDFSGSAPGFFLAAFIPYIVPLMFSTIGIGQEGNSVINLLSLPIKPTELIKGKLVPAWLISGLATVSVIIGMEFIAPIGLTDFIATLVVASMAILINSFIGLGVGSRWPDYVVSARSRYITMKGFLIGFLLSGLATLAIYAPIALHIVTSGGIRGQVPGLGFNLTTMFVVSLAIGSLLSYISYIFCKRGVERFLTSS